jgi:hypothetical protein
VTFRRVILAAALASCVTLGVDAGPVDVYLDGPEYCPRDQPKNAPRMNAEQAIARTRALLPKDYCGPTVFVSGCTFDAENEYDSWRIFVEQYKVVSGRQDKGGLLHTYLILDPVGNCLAHIPGTLLGAIH